MVQCIKCSHQPEAGGESRSGVGLLHLHKPHEIGHRTLGSLGGVHVEHVLHLTHLCRALC